MKGSLYIDLNVPLKCIRLGSIMEPNPSWNFHAFKFPFINASRVNSNTHKMIVGVGSIDPKDILSFSLP